jgi:hypothetical protein
MQVGPDLVEFLSLPNDLELYRSYAAIIFLASFASKGGLNKDATVASMAR